MRLTMGEKYYLVILCQYTAYRIVGIPEICGLKPTMAYIHVNTHTFQDGA